MPGISGRAPARHNDRGEGGIGGGGKSGEKSLAVKAKLESIGVLNLRSGKSVKFRATQRIGMT
jgi:hypothetical protein